MEKFGPTPNNHDRDPVSQKSPENLKILTLFLKIPLEIEINQAERRKISQDF